MITQQTQRQIEQLASQMAEQFTPPEYIPGCLVQSVADVNQYGNNNGWIEATVGRHNQQRCRWRGQFESVTTGDVVDVLYYPSYRVFVVFGQGGGDGINSKTAASIGWRRHFQHMGA